MTHTSDYYAPDSYPGNKGLQFRWKRLHSDLGSDRDEVRFGEWNELKIDWRNEQGKRQRYCEDRT